MGTAGVTPNEADDNRAKTADRTGFDWCKPATVNAAKDQDDEQGNRKTLRRQLATAQDCVVFHRSGNIPADK